MQGERIVEEIPVEKVWTDYERVDHLQYVPVERREQELYQVETITEMHPQVKYETKVEFVPQTVIDYETQKRTDYVEQRRTEYVTQMVSAQVPQQVTDYVTNKRTEYVEQKRMESVPQERIEMVPVEREERVPVERTEMVTRHFEEMVPVERVEMVERQVEEMVTRERVVQRPVQREQEVIDYIPVKKSIVHHHKADGTVTTLNLSQVPDNANFMQGNQESPSFMQSNNQYLESEKQGMEQSREINNFGGMESPVNTGGVFFNPPAGQ